MLDVVAEHGSEGVGAVAGRVVGHHSGDCDARFGEERSGMDSERSCGFFVLVRQAFEVGQPGAVINGVVQAHVAA
jgi:hypothetical protein